MMDFGPAPESKPEIKAKPQPRVEHRTKPKSENKRRLLIALILITLGLLAVGIYLLEQPRNPLPANIKNQVSYKTIYPTSKVSIDLSSYQYQAANKALTFNAVFNGNKIVFAEQPAPTNVGSGNQVYYPALGLHPYAQFQSKVGPVALAKFYNSGSLTPAGQSGILVTQGTLVIVHTDKNLTNDQWKQLFDSLVITK